MRSPCSSLPSITNVSFGLNTSWGRTCNAACQAAEDAENPYEEIEIVGERPEEFEPPDIIDDGVGDVGVDNDGGNEGSDPAGSTEPEGKDDPEKDRSACLHSAKNFKYLCLGNVGADGVIMRSACEKLGVKTLENRCKTVTTVVAILSTAVCLTIDSYNSSQCEALPEL